jgi:hypothetical protein
MRGYINHMKILKDNYLIIFALTTCLLLGGVGGYYGFYKLGPISQVCDIKYISYDEIVTLEKKRIASSSSVSEDKNLFFGRGKEVAEKIAVIADNYRSNKTKVIFTSSSIKGSNVKSISGEIHSKIIAELKSAEYNENRVR